MVVGARTISNGMSKNLLIAVVVLVVAVGAGAAYYFGFDHGWENAVENTENEDMMADDGTMGNDMIEGDETTPPSEGHGDLIEGEVEVTVGSQVREFTVVATPFKFDVTEIKVKKGDTVRIVFKNEGGMHDWVVDEFNARTKQLQAGQTETIEFVADKVGTFEYYCSVMQHRQMGMVGKLIVE